MKSARKTKGWSSAIDTDGSAAQPATYMHQASGTAEETDSQDPSHKLAFYNVGLNSSDKEHTVARLADEVLEIVTTKNLDAFGLCEIFNQREDELQDRRVDIMSELLRVLNQGSAEQPAWQGKTDVHYIFL